jgi:hypothetical protein
MVDAPFINTRDGRLMTLTVTVVGMEKLEVTNGTIEAWHYAIRGNANLDTFCDLTPHWAGLPFIARDGSVIRYRGA